MTWVFSKKHLACLSLLVMMMVEMETSPPCFADGCTKLSRFKGGRSGSEMNSLKPNKGFNGHACKDGDDDDDDDAFGAEKRKVYTGSNPLHNR
ncbi:hypothetical protein U1Q18_007806 [Sarracenia purpurea var. burkii]